MKIILFTDSLGAGGAQRQLVGLAELLKDAGEDITVLTYHKDEFYAPFLAEKGIEHILLEDAQGPLKRISKVCAYIRRETPDVVIAYQEVPSLIACLAKIYHPKFKLVVSERNTTQKIDSNVKTRFFFYKWADAIVPNSYSQERFIAQNYSKLINKVSTITNFVNLDRFNAIERSFSFCDEKPIIMVAASIFPSKNTLGFVDALHLVKKRGGKNFLVKWYGFSERNVDYFNQCVMKIKTLGLEDCVQLLPKTQNIKECYDKARYFCLPSFFEGTPNVICEAISCGLPVLCSDVCDNALYVREGENGFLFDPKSPESIADAITRMLSLNESQYVEFAKNSRIIAERQLSRIMFLGKYQDVLKRL